jgi:hypothetical protein
MHHKPYVFFIYCKVLVGAHSLPWHLAQHRYCKTNLRVIKQIIFCQSELPSMPRIAILPNDFTLHTMDKAEVPEANPEIAML